MGGEEKIDALRAQMPAYPTTLVFAERPGPWALTVRASNIGGVAFWRRALERYGARQDDAVTGLDGNARIRFSFTVG